MSALRGRRPKLVVPRSKEVLPTLRRTVEYTNSTTPRWRWPASVWNKRLSSRAGARRAYYRNRPQGSPQGDRRRRSKALLYIAHGEQYRRLDGHGKPTGKRYTKGVDDTHLTPRHMMEHVRPVVCQQEDATSWLTRQRNRLHRLAMEE